MAIDPSISLQVQTPQPYDELGQAGKALQLKQLMEAANQAPMQRQMAELDLNSKQMQNKQMQQQMADDQALRGAYVLGPNGQLDRNATIANITKINPALVPKLSEQWQKDDAAKLKLHDEVMNTVGKAATSLITRYDEIAREKGEQAAEAEILPLAKQQAAQFHQQFPGLPGADPNNVTIQTVREAAGHYDKYVEHQLKQGSPQSAEGKILADRKAGILTQEQTDKALTKKDYIRPIINVNAGGSAESKLEPEDFQFMAKQYLSGDKSVLQNLGRGRQGAEDLRMLRKEIRRTAQAEGKTPEEIAIKMAEFEGLKAGERTAGTQGARVAIAAEELDKFIPLAEAAAGKVPRTGFVPMNKLIELGQNNWSPEQSAFVAANRSLINAFAQLSARGAATVHSTTEAEKMLSTASTPEQYKAVTKQLKAEAEAAKDAINAAKKGLRDSAGDGKPSSDGKRPPLSSFGG